MRKAGIFLALFGFAMLVVVPQQVYADPVRVTSGAVDLDFEGDVLGFFAPGFALFHAPVDPDGGDPNLGLFIPKSFDSAFCSVCDAGDTFNASFRTQGEQFLGVGRATVNGTSYSNLTFRGTLDFRAESVLLPDVPEDTFFNAGSPFTFTGFIRAFSGESDVFSVSLFGNGRTSVPFDFSQGRFFMDETGPTYLFADTAPVPEPSTMLLVGLGAAALVRAKRRALKSPTTQAESVPRRAFGKHSRHRWQEVEDRMGAES